MRGFFVEFLNPYPISMLLLAVGLANLWWKRRETCRRLLFVTAPFVVLLLLSLQPIEYVVLGSLEWRNDPLPARPPDAKAIVVLAAAVRPANDGRLQPELDERSTQRCLAASALYRQGPPCLVLVSGGNSDPSQPGPPCARAMSSLLLDLGVKESDLIVEEASRTTFENAVECRKLLETRKIDEIVLVTDSVHLERAAACFRKQGLTVIPAPSGRDAAGYAFGLEDLVPNPTSVRNCQRVWHEWIGSTWYWLRGQV
jgi:uncharacterized SAM-binding protein YcdF (DUF218 family)